MNDGYLYLNPYTKEIVAMFNKCNNIWCNQHNTEEEARKSVPLEIRHEGIELSFKINQEYIIKQLYTGFILTDDYWIDDTNWITLYKYDIQNKKLID